MINIFKDLDYNEQFYLEEWNQFIRDVFYQYFKDEKTFLRNKELLRAEVINYVKHIAKKEEYENLFKEIVDVFYVAIIKKPSEIFKELAINLEKVSNTDNLYLNFYIQQLEKNISNYTPRDFAIYYFQVINELLEGCFKPRFELFFQIYKVGLENTIPNISTKNFGDLVDKINNFDKLLKDPIFNISISQWRNISAHKNYKITKNNITVEYGRKDNRKIQLLSHKELKEITFWINSVYSILRLAEVIIYLNYTEEIMATDEAKNIDFDIRTESSLMHIIHNLQIVGFKFHSFNTIENIFELSLYIKQNKNIQESIIHASQVFVQIAIALDLDEFQKEKFEHLRINILNDYSIKVASASVDVKICLDYSYGKINMSSLISKIIFDF